MGAAKFSNFSFYGQNPKVLSIEHTVEQYLSVVLFDFQIYPVCNFGKSINFGVSTVRSERVTMFVVKFEAMCFNLVDVVQFYLCFEQWKDKIKTRDPREFLSMTFESIGRACFSSKIVFQTVHSPSNSFFQNDDFKTQMTCSPS